MRWVRVRCRLFGHRDLVVFVRHGQDRGHLACRACSSVMSVRVVGQGLLPGVAIADEVALSQLIAERDLRDAVEAAFTEVLLP